jgi:MoxR-like ATPase
MGEMEAALAEPHPLESARDIALRVIANVRLAVSGEPAIVERAVVALLAEGHVLVEDVPGVGKTTLARALARSLDCSFARIQLTPDVLPSDVTGVSVFDQRTSEFAFRPGPVFANIVLADELNRASPRTQSALLECMQERQVTVDGVARPLAAPFFVIATQNPIEQDGTFPLPEAQLDRFALRLALGYPRPGDEARMLADQTAPEGSPLETLAAVADAAELIAAVHACRSVHVAPALHEYVVALCGATRSDARLALGASPRAGVTLVRLARAHALVQGRDHVLPDDVKALAPDALAHRLLPAPGAPADVASVLEELLARVPVSL